MAEYPAAENQNTSDNKANIWEAINQARVGVREAGSVSKAMLLVPQQVKVVG